MEEGAKMTTKRDYDQPKTIEELLASRRKNPILTLALTKDIARRIKALEADSEKTKKIQLSKFF